MIINFLFAEAYFQFDDFKKHLVYDVRALWSDTLKVGDSEFKERLIKFENYLSIEYKIYAYIY